MFSAIVLAGGVGRRILSATPKLLQILAGRPLLESILTNIAALNPDQTVIVVSKRLLEDETWPELFKKWSTNFSNLSYVIQDAPGGTGHAVQVGLQALALQTEKVLICCGDTPLIQSETMRRLITNPADLTLGTMLLPSPEQANYGRVLFDQAGPERIIETRDATKEQQQIATANVGVYCVRSACLKECVFKITNHNAASEFYLTDIVHIARVQGYTTAAENLPFEEASGINTLEELAEAPVQDFLRKKWMANQVVLQDPKSTIFSMDTQIGAHSTIGAFVVLGEGVIIGEGATILPFCCLEHCQIASGCTIGPFAHIKAGSVIERDAVIGNFVEVKKSIVGEKTKIKHLSYIGDAEIGKKVNVGAGTIVCNYDGFQKHKTVIEDEVSVGANTSLVAPLKIGFSAFIGAGSVITQEVPAYALALSRSPQVFHAGWSARKKRK